MREFLNHTHVESRSQSIFCSDSNAKSALSFWLLFTAHEHFVVLVHMQWLEFLDACSAIL